MSNHSSNDNGFKSVVFAVLGGVLTMCLIIVGSLTTKVMRETFTTDNGVVCEKPYFGKWECTYPTTGQQGQGPHAIKVTATVKTDESVLTDEELQLIISDVKYQTYRHVPKVSAYIRHAKEDGKITKDESNLIYQLIDEAAKKRESLKSTDLVNQL